jgi:L-fuconolactonase
MIIDSHQHFWKYNSETHAWIDDSMANIRKNFLPRELETVYQVNGIDACIAVQADQTLEETNFLLDLAYKNSFIKGVVGWVDLRALDIEEQLHYLRKHDLLKGFRHIVQGETDPEFMLRPAFLNGISKLEQFNFTYDILIFASQLDMTLKFVEKFPNQKFVIDHIAKPNIKEGKYEDWADNMNALSKFKNVRCKLSGIITEADYKSWTQEQVHPYIETALNTFGTDRCMFGSDWPVCLVAGTYGRVKKLITDAIAHLDASKQADIMGNNAAEFYNL